MAIKDQPNAGKQNSSAEVEGSSHELYPKAVLNSLHMADQKIYNDLLKLKSSQNLLVNKLHTLEALTNEISNELLRLRADSQEVKNG